MSQSGLLNKIDDLISLIEDLPSANRKSKPTVFSNPNPIEIKLPTTLPPKAQNVEASSLETRSGHKRPRERNVLEEEVSVKKAKPQQNSLFNLQHEGRVLYAKMVGKALKELYPGDWELDYEFLEKQMGVPKHGQGHLSFGCFRVKQMLGVQKINPKEVATNVCAILGKNCPNDFFVKVASAGPYLNLTLNPNFLGQILQKILAKDNSFVDAIPKPSEEKEVVMVEYSQPNTHKAFHVGHMRNCAIGDCLVRLYEHIGHKVIAVNYFGDEGAHTAKCLWLLNKKTKEGFDLKSVSEENRGEWLGQIYTESNNMVALYGYTKFELPSVVVAQVLEKKPHPKNKDWNVCVVDYGVDKASVVCAGTHYKVGDKVPYAPVGGRYKDKPVVAKEMKGVPSNGVIYGASECGVRLPPLPQPKEVEKEDSNSGKKKKKKKKKSKQKIVDKRILIVDPKIPVGTTMIEVGLKPDLPEGWLPEGETPESIIKKRKQEMGDILKKIEARDEYWVKLFEETKEWSMESFEQIYNWLGCRFDHNFYESECSELSQKLVDSYLEKGVFEVSQGAVGCRFKEESKLPFCLLRKSNGAGLYATKDLALAEIKFRDYSVDRSVYVVDQSQSLHFNQVFETLKIMGFQQGDKCVHLPYAMVVGPDGKMSSRTGNVILFKDLKEQLGASLDEEFLNKAEGFTEEEKDLIRRNCSVGCIRYGMLNHDVLKDIVFDLKKWASVHSGGDTGPYLLYQYARIQNIKREITCSPEAEAQYSLLDDKALEILMQLSEFQSVIERTVHPTKGPSNPSTLCTYLFDLCQAYSSWYAQKTNSVKHAPDANTQLTRMQFCDAVGVVLGRGLTLLGIPLLEKM